MATIAQHELPLFEGLSKKDLRAVESLCTAATVPAGRTIVRAGEIGRECVVVVTGRAAVERSGEIIAYLGAGDVAGEISLLEGRGTRSATVTAATDCDVLVFSAGDFQQLLAAHPTITTRIGRAAVRRLLSAVA